MAVPAPSHAHVSRHPPSTSSRFWHSLSHGSVRRHFEGDNEREAEVDTGERLGLIRVRGGGRYGRVMEVDTGARSRWIRVRDGGGCRCAFAVYVESREIVRLGCQTMNETSKLLAEGDKLFIAVHL